MGKTLSSKAPWISSLAIIPHIIQTYGDLKCLVLQRILCVSNSLLNVPLRSSNHNNILHRQKKYLQTLQNASLSINSIIAHSPKGLYCYVFNMCMLWVCSMCNTNMAIFFHWRYVYCILCSKLVFVSKRETVTKIRWKYSYNDIGRVSKSQKCKSKTIYVNDIILKLI